MKQNIKNNLKAILLGLILTVGMGYAAAATFTDPKCAPPGCNTDAPITVGGGEAGNIYSQIKTGLLTLDHLITPDLQIPTGAHNGWILISDATGKASWADPATLGFGGGGSGTCSTMTTFNTQVSVTGTTWTVPPGVQCIKVQSWGAGGNGGGSSSDKSGGGGGGGGYSESAFLVVPGTVYSVRIDSGGGESSTQFSGTDKNGKVITFGAGSGHAGTAPASGNIGKGGQPGGGSGMLTISGAVGQDGIGQNNNAGGYGGGAGNGGLNVAGGANGANGNPGNFPGGGGSGAGDGNNSGGRGADGQMIINY